MNEMLGNQLFMARRYSEALKNLEAALLHSPEQKPIKRKLIICYAQTGDIYKSLNLFYDLIKDDIQFIIDADPILDDCPCNEIIEQLEEQTDFNYDPFETKIYQGIIWLYCDAAKSLSCFQKAGELENSNEVIKNVIELIEKYKAT
ncbi:MAG: hypothetical protein PHW27_09160 [Melioribacteraceae bacterium]|nr:hypothetical protein [Melioribacteraceae bacterium]